MPFATVLHSNGINITNNGIDIGIDNDNGIP